MSRLSLAFWRAHLPQVGIGLSLLLFALISANAIYRIDEFERRVDGVQHTFRVLTELEQTLSLLRDAQSAVRGFAISGQERFLAPYDDAKRAVPTQFSRLYALTTDNRVQQQVLADTDALAGQLFQWLDAQIAMRRQDGQPSQVYERVGSGRGLELMERITALIHMMQQEEKNLLSERERAAKISVNRSKEFILFGTLAAYLMIGIALWTLRQEIAKRQHAEAELVKTNDALQRHAEQLVTTNGELESFSYSVSHDLRIPLRAISGYARMLEEDYGDRLDAEAKRLLDVIRDNSHKMGDLIDDLLAFSRLGRAALTPTEVNMRDLIDVCVQDVMRREEYRRTEIVIGELANACGDRALLQQVWINLIANACKYSGAREHPVVRIEGQREGDQVRYAVADNGVGFDMQYVGKLFGVFQRLHGADEFPGTGVGLAIVHRIVTRHGGRVWAQGEVGQGATFYFTLPAELKTNGNG